MPVKYSPTEQKLLGLLRHSLPRDTEALAGLLYGNNGRSKPYHARIIVAAALRSLVTKTRRNRETFRIKQSHTGSGATPITYWLSGRV